MNKKGQFYLIAAVIIIGIILGFVTVSNTLRKPSVDNSKVYGLFVEVNIDTEKIINYPDGENGYSDDELKTIFENFIKIYSRIDKIYFLTRNEQRAEKLEFYKYDGNNIEFLGNIEDTEPIIITIDEDDYEFENLGDNFYYIIIKEQEEQYVIHG